MGVTQPRTPSRCTCTHDALHGRQTGCLVSISTRALSCTPCFFLVTCQLEINAVSYSIHGMVTLALMGRSQRRPWPAFSGLEFMCVASCSISRILIVVLLIIQSTALSDPQTNPFQTHISEWHNEGIGIGSTGNTTKDISEGKKEGKTTVCRWRLKTQTCYRVHGQVRRRSKR